jgi:nucleoside-diphosphate-sugar epimerase
LDTAVHLLVLGGTRFVGRAVVDIALTAGHRVTLFNRGVTAPGLYPRLETIIGDRTQDLSALHGRDFDVVVDVAGYHPGVVRLSARTLAERVGRYVFVSTVSVYADQSTPPSERSDRLALSEHTKPDDLYGARKAACEDVVQEVYGDRAFVVRPGLIVGPHDTSERFGYWPVRIAQGGRVLAPGDSNDPLQFIDVRDLAQWIVSGAGRGGAVSGAYNAVGEPMAFGDLLDICRTVSGTRAEIVWVPSDRLVAAGVDPDEGIPMWLAGLPGWQAANLVYGTRARSAGLITRPVSETVADTLAWERRRRDRRPGLSPAEEARLLQYA